MSFSSYLLQYAYTFLLSVITALLIFGCTEEEWGMGPNVVRVLTYGHYNYSMVIPTLCTSILICLLTVCYIITSFYYFIDIICIIPLVTNCLLCYYSNFNWF